MDNCYLDALAVITFFKMSHKKHLFITGDRGSGKSYLLNNILNQIEETMDMSDFFNYVYCASKVDVSLYRYDRWNRCRIFSWLFVADSV